MKLIQTITLTSSQASIQLTSIPQTFTDLVVLFSIRTDRAVNAEPCRISINSTSLTRRYLRGIGGGSYSSGTDIDFYVTGSSATVNTFANGDIYIPDYSLTTKFKTLSAHSVAPNNADSYGLIIASSRYSDNAAVTSLSLAPITGPNFVAGSTVSLYGILKGSDGITTAS
jgi:hypothetical protein